MPQVAEAAPLLEKVLAVNPHDKDALMDQARLRERTDPAAAEDAYRRAAAVMEAEEEEVPGALWNNVGVLCHKQRKYSEAIECFERAYQGLFC